MDCDRRIDGPIDATFGEGDRPAGSGTINLLEGTGRTTFTIQADSPAGTYWAGAMCPEENKMTRATFTVSPRGAPRGGTGLEDNGDAMALAGAGALAAAGAAGGFLLMRRRPDAPVA